MPADRIDTVLSQVLKKIQPSEAEKKKIREITERVTKVAEGVLKKRGLFYTLAGSFLRDTYMMDKREFDLFIMFPVSHSREDLERKGLEVGKEIVRRLKGKHRIAYAEHPYVRSQILGYAVDIVPCYKVRSATEIKSAVDRTPFHNTWLEKNLQPRLSSDVRLLKQFCKALGVYGSDAKTEGLSGYLCELLIVRYKSFRGLVKEAARWKSGVVVDIENHGVGEALNSKFRGQPLVVIDPVDPKRNVASALSPANFEKLVYAFRDFMKSPSEKFFEKPAKKVSPKEIKRLMGSHGTQLLVVEFRRPNVIDDIIWPQLRRFARRLSDILREYEFVPLGYAVHADDEGKGAKCWILLEMEVWSLPRLRKMVGPSVFSEKHSAEFLGKYKGKGRVFVEKDRWVAEVQRRFREADAKLRDSLKESNKALLDKGVPSHVAASISKSGFRILKNRESLSLASKNRGFAEFLSSYLTS